MQDARYEVKLVGAEHEHSRVLAELRLLPFGLVRQHRTRVVQSVYFDTADGRAVAQNLAGISERQKVRLRWYGDATVAVSAQLECKQRQNGVGGKATAKLREPLDVRGSLRHRFTDRVRGLVVDDAARCWLDGLEPAQWIRYRRDYLVTADRRLRVTLDRELRAIDQRLGMRLDDRRSTPLPRLLVVELKAAIAHRDELERLVAALPLRPGKCSKFVMASDPAEAPALPGL